MDVIVIAHNVRSVHNIGSLLRTAEGIGVKEVVCSGFTPYPLLDKDPRLPHEARKIDKKIDKTALGAQSMLDITHTSSLDLAVNDLRSRGYKIYALEQHSTSRSLVGFKSNGPAALIIGNEKAGLAPRELELCDKILEIPMRGKKESFNVVQAAAMALYQLSHGK